MLKKAKNQNDGAIDLHYDLQHANKKNEEADLKLSKFQNVTTQETEKLKKETLDLKYKQSLQNDEHFDKTAQIKANLDKLTERYDRLVDKNALIEEKDHILENKHGQLLIDMKEKNIQLDKEEQKNQNLIEECTKLHDELKMNQEVYQEQIDKLTEQVTRLKAYLHDNHIIEGDNYGEGLEMQNCLTDDLLNASRYHEGLTINYGSHDSGHTVNNNKKNIQIDMSVRSKSPITSPKGNKQMSGSFLIDGYNSSNKHISSLQNIDDIDMKGFGFARSHNASLKYIKDCKTIECQTDPVLIAQTKISANLAGQTELTSILIDKQIKDIEKLTILNNQLKDDQNNNVKKPKNMQDFQNQTERIKRFCAQTQCTDTRAKRLIEDEEKAISKKDWTKLIRDHPDQDLNLVCLNGEDLLAESFESSNDDHTGPTFEKMKRKYNTLCQYSRELKDEYDNLHEEYKERVLYYIDIINQLNHKIMNDAKEKKQLRRSRDKLNTSENPFFFDPEEPDTSKSQSPKNNNVPVFGVKKEEKTTTAKSEIYKPLQKQKVKKVLGHRSVLPDLYEQPSTDEVVTKEITNFEDKRRKRLNEKSVVMQEMLDISIIQEEDDNLSFNEGRTHKSLTMSISKSRLSMMNKVEQEVLEDLLRNELPYKPGKNNNMDEERNDFHSNYSTLKVDENQAKKIHLNSPNRFNFVDSPTEINKHIKVSVDSFETTKKPNNNKNGSPLLTDKPMKKIMENQKKKIVELEMKYNSLMKHYKRQEKNLQTSKDDCDEIIKNSLDQLNTMTRSYEVQRKQAKKYQSLLEKTCHKYNDKNTLAILDNMSKVSAKTYDSVSQDFKTQSVHGSDNVGSQPISYNKDSVSNIITSDTIASSNQNLKRKTTPNIDPNMKKELPSALNSIIRPPPKQQANTKPPPKQQAITKPSDAQENMKKELSYALDSVIKSPPKHQAITKPSHAQDKNIEIKSTLDNSYTCDSPVKKSSVVTLDPIIKTPPKKDLNRKSTNPQNKTVEVKLPMDNNYNLDSPIKKSSTVQDPFNEEIKSPISVYSQINVNETSKKKSPKPIDESVIQKGNSDQKKPTPFFGIFNPKTSKYSATDNSENNTSDDRFKKKFAHAFNIGGARKDSDNKNDKVSQSGISQKKENDKVSQSGISQKAKTKEKSKVSFKDAIFSGMKLSKNTQK